MYNKAKQSTGRIMVVAVFAKNQKPAKTAPTYAPVFEALYHYQTGRKFMKPTLNKNISPDIFRDYYWLKTELAKFCRDNGLSTTGAKKEIETRIVHYLNTGEKLSPEKRQGNSSVDTKASINLNTLLKDAYKSDQTNRVFFKSIIGERFKFNVMFMKWVKLNPKKTYQEAVDEWLRIEADKKSGKSHKIAPQFEYNQYTRDFFIANPGRKRADAITCWKYKKGLPGTNSYEGSDLESLNNA
ncbi:MAG: hypothetical protein ACI9T7_002370 [Oleiphilaceae bacterium]